MIRSLAIGLIEGGILACFGVYVGARLRDVLILAAALNILRFVTEK